MKRKSAVVLTIGFTLIFVTLVPAVYNSSYQHGVIGIGIGGSVCFGSPDQFRSISLVVFGGGAAVRWGTYVPFTFC